MMILRTVQHRGLKRFIENDDSRGIRADLVNRVRAILSALIAAQDIEGMRGPPGWRLSVERQPRRNVEHFVSGNWRITFSIEAGEVCDLDLEDYH
ncbi:MAG TPA: type II toxin-antitoxin system RelE/ParE family toxin [Propylenella sp.]|nr:type II toxin-antitoxin system RelE/ParE family toxin [Propylenella sp.]